MRSCVRAFTLPLGGQAFLRLTAHLYKRTYDIAGYYSRIHDREGNAYGHTLMVDIDSGDPWHIWRALQPIAYDQGWPDAWLLMTDNGWHAVSTGVFDAQGVIDAYQALAREGIRVDYRHLGVGLVRGTWTLRLGRKDDSGEPVRVVAYDHEMNADAPWSYGHWRLLAGLFSGRLREPTGEPINSVTPVVSYKG